MEWFVLAAVGAIIGTITSFIGVNLKMPQSLVIGLATAGAIAGGLIDRMTNTAAFGYWTFYVAGVGMTIVVLAGAFLAYSLTNEEKKV